MLSPNTAEQPDELGPLGLVSQLCGPHEAPVAVGCFSLTNSAHSFSLAISLPTTMAWPAVVETSPRANEHIPNLQLYIEEQCRINAYFTVPKQNGTP